MVRRATRTYSAIERSFQTLELKESQTRSFFRPFDEQELERLQQDAGFGTSSRHRYAEALQWADDVSALLTVDNPAAAEAVKRRQCRATSALMRSRSYAAGAGSSARPNSAPPGFDPASVGSALQAALQGVVESARTRAAAPHASRGFESRLMDEYLRAQSLQPASASASPLQEQQATGRDGRSNGPGPGGVPEADVSNLPLINEGVEEVEEGMDGEELSPDALLMYYGSRRPRRSSNASARSISPASRSRSPAGMRPASATPAGCSSSRQQQGRPRGSAGPSRSGGDGSEHPPQQRHGRPPSASWSASRLQRSLSATAPVEPEARSSDPRPSSSWQQLRASRPTGARTLPSRPWSACPAAAAPRAPGAAAAPQQQRRASASQLGLQGNCLQLGSRPAAKLGPSNGVVLRDPAGPPVATHRAQRPMSARCSGGRSEERGATGPSPSPTSREEAGGAGPAEGREHTLLSIVADMHAQHRAAGGGGPELEAVGRHGAVRSLMASQAARQAAMTRAAVLSGGL